MKYINDNWAAIIVGAIIGMVMISAIRVIDHTALESHCSPAQAGDVAADMKEWRP